MDVRVLCVMIITMCVQCALGCKTASQTEKLEILGKCSGGNVARVGLDNDCSLFAPCPASSRNIVFIQCCPPGTLYDRNRRICNHAELVDCSTFNSRDPCSGQLDGYIRDNSARSFQNQDAVFECLGGKTINGRRCRRCQVFGGPETPCVTVPCRFPTPPPTGCQLEADPNDPTKFYNNGHGTRQKQSCAPGTEFRQDACLCL